MIKIKK